MLSNVDFSTTILDLISRVHIGNDNHVKIFATDKRAGLVGIGQEMARGEYKTRQR